MQLGKWRLDSVCGGTFRLDGGAMFGIVPKPLWERLQPADQRNRIRMRANCVLARDGRHTVLIDTGYGGKHSPRDVEINALEPGEPLLENLARLDVAAGDVDLVVLSHLHFDHVGGASRRDASGRLVTTFPRAKYFVQRGEWHDATSGVAELRGSYLTDDLEPLEACGRLTLIEGDVELIDGLSTIATGGHTRGHQAIVLESQGQKAIYPADLCPMTAHVHRLWCMGYDLFPLETRRRKPLVLGQAADEDWLVLWDHDPDVVASRLARDPKRDFAIVEPLTAL